MTFGSESRTMRIKAALKDSAVGRLFYDKKFFHYTWIGAGISALNIALLWLFIDVFLVPTITSSIIVIGGTFLLRYILFVIFKVL